MDYSGDDVYAHTGIITDISTYSSGDGNKASDTAWRFVKTHTPGQPLPESLLQMKKDGDHFWIKLGNLITGREYVFQYLVDGEIRLLVTKPG